MVTDREHFCLLHCLRLEPFSGAGRPLLTELCKSVSGFYLHLDANR